MFCKKCNSRNEETSKFCSNCGNRLTAETGTGNVSYSARNKMFLLVMLFLVLLVAAIVVFNIMSNPETASSGSINSDIDSNESASSNNNSSQSDNKNDSNQAAADMGYREIRFDQEVSTDFVEFTIQTTCWSFDLLPSETSGVYSYYEGTEGEMFYYLQGTIKNTHGQQYDIDNMEIEMTFNDSYTYRGRLAAESADKKGFRGDRLNPLQETTFYIYTNVPDELYNKFETCETRIAFEDEFKRKDYSVSVEEMQYKYRIISGVELIGSGKENTDGVEKDAQIKAEEDYIYWVDFYLEGIELFLGGLDIAVIPGVRKDTAWEESIDFCTNTITENCEEILSLEVPNKYEDSSKYLKKYCQEIIKGMGYYAEHNFSKGDTHINEAEIQLSTYYVMRN